MRSQPAARRARREALALVASCASYSCDRPGEEARAGPSLDPQVLEDDPEPCRFGCAPPTPSRVRWHTPRRRGPRRVLYSTTSARGAVLRQKSLGRTVNWQLPTATPCHVLTPTDAAASAANLYPTDCSHGRRHAAPSSPSLPRPDPAPGGATASPRARLARGLEPSCLPPVPAYGVSRALA